ncbi:MAG TPA: S8 family serine peptidase [Phycisphaerae bacterium]|nr:S8 family serine peptidase [Phycisphaerae bacterium]
MLKFIAVAAIGVLSSHSLAAAFTPDDPYYLPYEWYASTLNLPTAWGISAGSPSVTIAVLDTGVRADSPDLAGRVLPTPADALADTGYTQMDGTEVHHGTWVASVAAMGINNSIGGTGVGNFSILPITATNSQGNPVDPSGVANAVRLAADSGAKVINVSLQLSSYDGLESAAAYAKSKGALTFVAAGNTNEGSTMTSFSDIIFVAGTDENDQRWVSTTDPTVGSTFGPFVTLSAPASNILVEDGLNAAGTDAMGLASGTSFSAAFASGAAALAWSINPNLTPDQVEQMLIDTSVDLGAPGYDDEFGYGRIDIGAVAIAAQASLVPEPASVSILGIGTILLLRRRARS